MPRWFDIVVATLGLLLGSPVLFVISVIIIATSRGSIFHVARRAGQGGTLFFLYKFRTMVPNAQSMGSGITVAGDRRITSIGRILRATKLDELPQLINVLKGDMTFVGPRPEDPRYLRHYPDDLLPILRFKPGITSPASIAYRNESELLNSEDHEREYIERILPDKLRLDLAYFDKATFRSDLTIMFRTIAAVFHRS
jgi:lipopolysaccharide/colanic/teichoic acid biosynthesis glycosyltransferase